MHLISQDSNTEGGDAGANAVHLAHLALLPEDNPNPLMIAQPSAKLVYAQSAASAVGRIT